MGALVYLCVTLLAMYVRYCQAQDTNSTTIVSLNGNCNRTSDQICLVVSQDGNCGSTTNQTCIGSNWGNCCSGKGYCGSTEAYCNADCQTAFGLCTANASSISSNGQCGSTDPDNQICQGSSFGICCSHTGWCGSTGDYCTNGCQSEFGDCDASNNIVISSSSSAMPTATSQTQTPSANAVSTSGSSSTTTAIPSVSAVDSMSTGAKAGIGVGVSVVALSLIAALVLLFRRRRSKQQTTAEILEKADTIDSAVHDKQDISMQGSKSSVARAAAVVDYSELESSYAPAELHDHRISRAELGIDEPYTSTEVDPKPSQPK